MSVRTYPKPEVDRTTTGLSVQFVAREKISLDRGALHNDAFRLLTVSSMFSSHDTYDANVLRTRTRRAWSTRFISGHKTPRSAHCRPPVPCRWGGGFELVKEPGSRWFADSPSIRVDILNRKAVPIRLGLQGYLLDKKDPNEDLERLDRVARRAPR